MSQKTGQSSKWPKAEHAILKDFGAKLRKFKSEHTVGGKAWRKPYAGARPTGHQAHTLLLAMEGAANNMSMRCSTSTANLPDFSIMVHEGTKQMCFTFHVNQKGSILSHNGCA